MFNRTLPIASAAYLLIAAPCFAQHAQMPRWTETKWPINRTVGPIANKTPHREILDANAEDVGQLEIIRLKFSSWNLPVGAAVRLTSPRTLQVVEMNDQALRDWSGFTPMFGDDALFIELVADPGVSGAGYTLESVIGISTQPLFPRVFNPGDNVCGTDDRARQNATAVARQWIDSGICTASLIATGDAAVSAGHCGNPQPGNFIEFDPPDSTALGNPVPSLAINQFPIDTTRVQRNFTFTFGTCPPPNVTQQCILTLGQDALAFGLNRNTSNQTAGARRAGFMRIARATGVSSGFTGTKWGCGITTPAGLNSRTLKVLSDTVSGQRVDYDGGDYWEYSWDTTGGDSGGPLVHTGISASVGVITFSEVPAGQCDSGAYAFSNPEFTNAIETVINQASTRFVDSFNATPGDPLGSIWRPSTSFRADAYDVVPTNGTVVIAPGTFVGGNVLSRPATIRAPFGAVTLTRQ